jgi:hypothetical protein
MGEVFWAGDREVEPHVKLKIALGAIGLWVSSVAYYGRHQHALKIQKNPLTEGERHRTLRA